MPKQIVDAATVSTLGSELVSTATTTATREYSLNGVGSLCPARVFFFAGSGTLRINGQQVMSNTQVSLPCSSDALSLWHDEESGGGSVRGGKQKRGARNALS